MKIFLVSLILKEVGFSDDELVDTIIVNGVLLFNHIVKYEDVEEYINVYKIKKVLDVSEQLPDL